MQDTNNKKLAITIGDPSSISAEIILKWVEENENLHDKVEVIAHLDFLDKLPDTISKKSVGDDNYRAILGKPDMVGATVAFEALEVAAQGCLDGIYRAVTTGPISKSAMKDVGFNFSGQTEFFASRWDGLPVMAFAGQKLIMSLVTWHEPLRSVYSSADEAHIIRAVNAIAKLTKAVKGIDNPRIAVCGLNPHAGEGGLLGAEEKFIINPILTSLRKKHPNLSEALPPDTVFARTLKGEFDCIVAMYHDQGLAPLKAIEFDNAVNVSLNLKHIRTSPDHGTAFSIAGKNIASANSFTEAVKLALKMSELT